MLKILINKGTDGKYNFNSLVGKEFNADSENLLTSWDKVHFYKWDKKNNILKIALKKGGTLIKAVSIDVNEDFDKVMEYKYDIKFVESIDSIPIALLNKTEKELSEIRSGLSLLVNKGLEKIKDVSIQQKDAFKTLYNLDLNDFDENNNLIDMVKDSYI